MITVDCFAYKSGLEGFPYNLPLCVTCVILQVSHIGQLRAVPPNILWDQIVKVVAEKWWAICVWIAAFLNSDYDDDDHHDQDLEEGSNDLAVNKGKNYFKWEI